jgi:hypothetical protein
VDREDQPNEGPILAHSPGFTVPAPTRIQFDGADPGNAFGRELRNVELTGTVRDFQTAPKCNIIDAVLQSLLADSVDFSRCDFKDDAIRSSRFTACHFDYLSFAYNAVFDSRFELCSFKDTDIHNCEFVDTVFVECDLSHVLIKNCTFIACEFRDCRTSNKVFETSRFADCRFRGTELQIETIEDNFGITSDQYDGKVRDDRVDNPHRKFSADELLELLESRSRHPLKKLNLEYFVNNSLLEGSLFLDSAVKLESWIPLSKTAGSFAIVLSQWVEFILWLYERDQLTVHTVICLYSMTGGLLARFGGERTHNQALATISGAHLSLGRTVEGYLVTLELCERLTGRCVTLVLEGGDSKSYYYEELAELFKRAEARITRLVPRNSPWEAIVTFAQNSTHYWFTALLLATRTEVELARISERMRLKDDSISRKGTRRSAKTTDTSAEINEPDRETLMKVGLGLHAMPGTPTVSLMTRLPGNLVVELRLDVGSRQIAAMRQTLKDML